MRKTVFIWTSFLQLKQDPLTELFNTPVTLAVLFFRLCISRKYKDKKLRLSKKTPDFSDFSRICKSLESSGIIRAAHSSHIYNIIGKTGPSAEQIICAADPFAYISHLSAMSYYGMTDRIPKTVFFSSPPSDKWRDFASERMRKDLGEYIHSYNLLKLKRISFDKIGKYNTSRYSSVHTGKFKIIKDEGIRVSTTGRVFLEMIQRPDLCNGIYHVIDVYQEHAERYLDLIVSEIDADGKKIDKVRAGYILEEVCNLQHNTIEGWLKFVQRGGSRKLDMSENYSPNYSERWCLSLNI